MGSEEKLSDHRAILLVEEDKNWGPIPFRFIDARLNHPKFGDLVKQLNVFGNVETQIKKAEDVLYNLDLCLESRGLNADEKTFESPTLE